MVVAVEDLLASVEELPRLEVWTDGACSGAPGIGGWAWATEDGRHDFGGHPSTTNNRMELMAALQAARHFEGELITVVTDSAYVMNCFIERWWHTWVEKDWRKKQGEVKNRDLWEELIELVVENDVQFRKVKGHSGDRMNDLVDKLAVKAKKAQLIRD